MIYNIKGNEIKVDRINSDSNGNPRYVVHFLNLTKSNIVNDSMSVSERYQAVINECKKLHLGKKYHNKQYGGGIAICTYNIEKDLTEYFNN